MIRHLLLLCLMLGLAGCEFARKQSFGVVVRNRSDLPVTVWLVKEGIPPEDGWRSPEELAIAGYRDDQPLPGLVVPAGRTAETSVTGNFYRETRAMLRVYFNVQDIDTILATSIGSSNRQDVPLTPGDNEFIVEPGSTFRLTRKP